MTCVHVVSSPLPAAPELGAEPISSVPPVLYFAAFNLSQADARLARDIMLALIAATSGVVSRIPMEPATL